MEIFERFERTVVPRENNEVLRRFLLGVYGWMGVGLMVTSVTAWLVATSPALSHAILGNHLTFFALLGAQIAIVVALTARVKTMSGSAAKALFLLYSIITGATLSVTFLVYSARSIETTFLVTAGSFAALALYGTVTRRDLQGIGQFLFMGLAGLVFASLVQVFWPADVLRFMIDFVGVIVFAGLTAWDAQRLRELALSGEEQASVSAINGALALYLDFINLFMALLGDE